MNGVICASLAKVTLAAHPPAGTSHAAAQASVANWDAHQSDTAQLYNRWASSATGVSPHELVYGRSPTTWVGRALGLAAMEDSSGKYNDLTEDEEAELIAKAVSTRRELEKYASGRQEVKNRQNKEYYDSTKAAGTAQVSVGDMVTGRKDAWEACACVERPLRHRQNDQVYVAP